MNKIRFWLRLLATVLPIITLVLWCDRVAIPDARFRRLHREFTTAYQATYSPFYDSLKLGILEPEKLLERNRLLNHYYLEFQSFANKKLRPIHRKQWETTQHLIKSQLHYLPTLQKDPTLYHFGAFLEKTLQLKGVILNDRLQQIDDQLQSTSQYYTIAKNNLVQPNAIKLPNAIQQQVQTLQWLRVTLSDSIAQATLPYSQRQYLLQHSAQAQIAIKDFIAFCRSIWLEYQSEKLL